MINKLYRIVCLVGSWWGVLVVELEEFWNVCGLVLFYFDNCWVCIL